MSGTKFDNAKPKMDLLSAIAEEKVAEVLTHGAEKYSANNWRAGIQYSRVYAATRRHLSAFWRGEDIDPESGLHHLAHAACELMFLLEYTSMPETYSKLDDRYKWPV